jgi:hypothetical protein
VESVKAPAPKVFFFGCLKDMDEQHTEAGHYLREPGYRQADRRSVITPFGSLDGTLCPTGGEQQGLAKLHHKDGWTAMGFWDRTGDTRMGSNSNFIVRGTYTFEEMCKLAQEQYPELWKRIGQVREDA